MAFIIRFNIYYYMVILCKSIFFCIFAENLKSGMNHMVNKVILRIKQNGSKH